MKLFVRSPFRNRRGLHGRVTTLILAAVLLAGGPAARAGKKDTGTDNSGAAASASPTPKAPRFDVPIPVSHDAQVVNLPYFDVHGKLQMYFYIKKAVRVDTNHLAMEKAYMQTYDEKGVPDANVFMTRSMLDLDTRIVTSDVPVIVRRSDFAITGQKMIFNTQTRVGRMTGHVQMVIYNRQDMSQSSPSPSPSANSSPGPSPTPQSSATPH